MSIRRTRRPTTKPSPTPPSPTPLRLLAYPPAQHLLAYPPAQRDAHAQRAVRRRQRQRKKLQPASSEDGDVAADDVRLEQRQPRDEIREARAAQRRRADRRRKSPFRPLFASSRSSHLLSHDDATRPVRDDRAEDHHTRLDGPLPRLEEQRRRGVMRRRREKRYSPADRANAAAHGLVTGVQRERHRQRRRRHQKCLLVDVPSGTRERARRRSRGETRETRRSRVASPLVAATCLAMNGRHDASVSANVSAGVTVGSAACVCAPVPP